MVVQASGSVKSADASGLSEYKLISILVIVTLIIGALGIIAVPFISTKDRSGDYIEYSAILRRDGTLDEVYKYHLTGNVRTRMLYRFWEMPLSLNELTRPQIKLIEVVPPDGTIAYVKDYQGVVTLLNDAPKGYEGYIDDLVFDNEAGCYNPNYFSPGDYEIIFKFKLMMEIESDSQYDHMNLMLAREHLVYKSVTITLEDSDYLSAVYQHPPSLSVTQLGGNTVISGSSAENELLEVEMLTLTTNSPWRGYSYVIQETNTKGLTDQANQFYSTQYWGAHWLGEAAKAAVLLSPIIFLGLWYRYGREEDVTVPTYLSTLPNLERKPWLVNLIFTGGVSDLSEDAFYATLLDLQRSEKIRIEPREGGMKIFLLDKSVDDTYEGKVLEFLSKLANDDQTVFDTESLKLLTDKISSGILYSKAYEAQKDLLLLTNPGTPIGSNLLPMFLGIAYMSVFLLVGIFIIQDPIFILASAGMMAFILLVNIVPQILKNREQTRKPWYKLTKGIFVNGRNRLWPITAVGALLLLISMILLVAMPIVSTLLYTPLVLGAVLVGQAIIAYVFPSTLFGRWAKGVYKEKREWDAFRNFLSDLSQLRKYSIEDLSMWGSWLVYGTALGVGDKVAEAMKALNVKLDAAPILSTTRTHFHPMIVATISSPSGSGGGGRGGGGGSHGGGGGRGGGGGGRR
jgi:uncharacterized membrane protein